MTYTVVLLHEEDGRSSAVVPALDVASWGHTIPQALRTVQEAIQLHIESLQAHGDPVPDDTPSFTVEIGDATGAVIYRQTPLERAIAARTCACWGDVCA